MVRSVDITTQTLQGFLDDAWDAAPVQANTFRAQLRKFESSATLLFSGGSIGSVSKNSVSQSYRGPGLGSYTPVQIANAWRDLINLFDSVKKQIDCLIAAGNTDFPDDTDETIYEAMKSQLIVITEYQPNMTDLYLTSTRPVTW